MPSIPNHGLDQTIQSERLRFDSWKKANDESRILRVQLMSISKDDPQNGGVSSQIQIIQSLNNQYMDSTAPLICSSVTSSDHSPLCHDVQSIVNNPPTISSVDPPIHLPYLLLFIFSKIILHTTLKAHLRSHQWTILSLHQVLQFKTTTTF